MATFFSLNPLARLGIGVQNALRNAVGDAPFDTSAFRFDIPDGQAAARIRETLRSLARAMSYPFGYRLRTRWAPAGKGARASTLSGDALLASLALRYYDPALAAEIVRPFFMNQTIEGMIPNLVSPMSISAHPATPLLLAPVTRAHIIRPDPETLKYCYNRSLKFSDWLAVRQKREDGFFHPAGADDLLPFRAFAPGLKPGAAPADTIHVGANCIQIILYFELARAAALLDSQREARKFRARARKLSRLLLDHAWDPERRDLYDVVAGKRADAPSPVAFLALPAEVVSREQAALIIEKTRQNPDLLQPRDSAHALLILLLLNGMENYGFAAAAGALAHEALGAAAAAENIFVAAAALPLLLQHIIGYHPSRDRVVLAPRIPEAWRGRALTVEDTAAGRTVALTLEDDNKVKCHLRAAGAPDIETEVENNKFRNFIAPRAGEGEKK